MTVAAPIRVLSDAVINQIAAGEVVERPASVLKELVENAVDAGAARIEVDVVDGGRRLVRVRDDGSGMDRDNALLSIERHATSKLRELKDLDSIVTMGFRGEALAAIAAVSQFTLITNRAESPAGTEILVFGGRVQEVRDAGAPPGTDIAVRNLFFNVPARRKFLRSAQTEFNHLRQAFLLQALGHIDIAFSLRADDADVYRLPACHDLQERIRDLYGAEVADHLQPIRFGSGTVTIGGYAGLPPCSRTDREWQVVFINGRPSGSPVINFAIQTAYRDVLPGGRYAPVFLQVDLPSDLVDVNVHPAKKEVRFRRPTEVRDVVIEAIRQAITGPELPGSKRAARSPDRGQGRSVPPVPAPKADAPPAPKSAAPIPTPPVGVIQSRLDWTPLPDSSQELPPAAKSPWSEYRLLGRVGGLYVVLETGEGLVLLDPRAAHERVIYERLLGGLEKGKVPAQGLLPPATVTLSPMQAVAMRKHLGLLRSMGFGVAEFGRDAFLVDALPVWIADVAAGSLLSDLADGLMQGGKMAAREWAQSLIAAIAGRQAMGLQRELTETELHALVRDLARAEMPYTSPRGKPTVILLSFRELNRKFGRE
ncbi:MAG: DNA mismatch repair endonuclease MutL [Kiritimatiellae bacterium]|jgi:DNA mismatch repair protein MutL|nr:DNA mismatch repair endonuclease MutL [Kiritimatiellia bacterium]NLD89013.1 DNA mismatch repair endonuclease MutL [Lentisphaerota bacterium]HPC18649.1 DNA mismatch repair endonuclease MutL [Kiritimatiellia bacterium]HQN80857.1 DNA mismatch repair endonuclease MutL [Kiritimatiellia bacterium]HQQ60531.1 DNA mismatch repair endonuclease MutL [Kiritimatiellia bacterium]